MADCSIEDCASPAKARGWCIKHWYRWRNHGDPNIVLKRGPKRGVCSIPGCEDPHYARGWCSRHYYRYLRHGDPLVMTTRERGSGSIHEGYLKIYLPEHPLASRKGYVYQHRAVLLDSIGGGEHPCWNCSRIVSWGRTYPEHGDGLVVDHIDRDRLNNDPANLRASCAGCNVSR